MYADDLAARLEGLDPAGLARVGAAVAERLAAEGCAAGLREVAAAGVGGLAAGGDGPGLLAVLQQTAAGLGQQALGAAVGDDGLRASVRALHRCETIIHSSKLRRIAEVDERGAYAGRAMSTAGWLADELGLTRGEARVLADTAKTLERLPEVAARLATGAISAGHAVEVGRTVAELDRLAAAAAKSDREAGHHEDAESEQGPRDAVASVGGAGAEGTIAALDALAAAQAPDSDRAQLRRCVADWAESAAPGLLAARDQRARANRRLWLGPDRDGMGAVEGRFDPVAFARLRSAVHARARKADADDPREFAQRCADALVELVDQAVAAGPPGGPLSGAQVLLVVEEDTLHDRPGAPAGHLDGWGAVSAATARQICCSAEVQAVVRGARQAVLNVGRADDSPTADQRRAVVARDRACVGCGASIGQCEVHHVVFKRHQGPTVPDNLVLVCWDCHSKIHHRSWRVTRGPDGRFRMEPPAGPEHSPPGGVGAGVGGTAVNGGRPPDNRPPGRSPDPSNGGRGRRAPELVADPSGCVQSPAQLGLGLENGRSGTGKCHADQAAHAASGRADHATSAEVVPERRHPP